MGPVQLPQLPALRAAAPTPAREAKGTASSWVRHGGASGQLLYAFGSYTGDGWGPLGGVVADKDGALYGTTFSGGIPTWNEYGEGTVFKLTPTGSGFTETILYSFLGESDGGWPRAGLIIDAKGALYGTAAIGGEYGYGAVFKLTPTGSGSYAESVIHSFRGSPDGYWPSAGLVADAKGTLCGTTAAGGRGTWCGQGCGTVFELRPTAGGGYRETILYSFDPAIGGGYYPENGLLLRDGVLYGTTSSSRPGWGTVFKLVPQGRQSKLSVIHFFAKSGADDGRIPQGPLASDQNGSLYGTTEMGGDSRNCRGVGCGVVFKLQPIGDAYSETIIYRFRYVPSPSRVDLADGAWPVAGVILDKKGAVYGTTSLGGTLGIDPATCIADSSNTCGSAFKLTPTRSGYAETIYPLDGLNGAQPYAGLTLIKGSLYGTATSGGSNGDGTVFDVSF